jgi:hypothetical protein
LIKPGRSAKARRARSGKPGKCGIVRLYGADLEALRAQRWILDGGICGRCGIATYLEARFDGDPMAYDMSHKRNKRMYGDSFENTKSLCHLCHMREHSGELIARESNG